MVRFTRGDMFASAYDIRVNTVNCVGVMGAGVALAFKERYPEMFREYHLACEEGRIRPGKIDVWRTLTDCVVNFPTKRHWRQKSRYEDIALGLESLADYLSTQGSVSVALPALGCGHGGLDWERVRPMIAEALGQLAADVIVFEPADSVDAGKRVHQKAAARRGIETHTLEPDHAGFPGTLRSAGIAELTILGRVELIGLPTVSFIMSPSPGERESSAARACVDALTRAGVALAFPFGSELSHTLAAIVAGESGTVVLWAAEGSDRVRVPAAIRAMLDAGTAIIATAAGHTDSWSAMRQDTATWCQIRASRAVVLTSPTPVWPPSLAEKAPKPQLPQAFFLRYDEKVAALLEARARPVGRHRSTGLPNVTPIIEAVGR